MLPWSRHLDPGCQNQGCNQLCIRHLAWVHERLHSEPAGELLGQKI